MTVQIVLSFNIVVPYGCLVVLLKISYILYHNLYTMSIFSLPPQTTEKPQTTVAFLLELRLN